MGYQSEQKLGFYWQMTQWSQKELQKKADTEGVDPAGAGEFVFPVLKNPMGDLEMQDDLQNNQSDN